MYQLPTLQVRLLEQVGAERREVVLPQRLGDKLLSVFGSPQTDLVTVRLSGTLVASIVTGVGPANEPFADFFVTKTIDCLRALESGPEAEEFTHFLLDPDQGALTPNGLMTVVDRYRPTAARMLAAFKQNRCQEPKNNVTVAPLYRSQIRVAVRDMLLGEKDIVHFSDADHFVAGQVHGELYFGVAGFYAVRGTNLLREHLTSGMKALSDVPKESLGHGFPSFLDFAVFHKTASAGRFNVGDLKDIAWSCLGDGEGRFREVGEWFSKPFSVQGCQESGRIGLHTVTLADMERTVVEGAR